MDMLISREESKLFFRLWLPLLKFVNEKYTVVPGLFQNDKIPDVNDLKKVQDKLIQKIECIDEYLEKYTFSVEEASLLSSWKNPLNGDFFVIKHLKKHSVFYCPERGKTLYGVMGINSTIDELLQHQQPPAYINAVLLPFNNKIITSGIIVPHRMIFGKGIKAEITEIYNEIKQESGICTQLISRI